MEKIKHAFFIKGMEIKSRELVRKDTWWYFKFYLNGPAGRRKYNLCLAGGVTPSKTGVKVNVTGYRCDNYTKVV